MIAKCCLTILDVKWDGDFWSSSCQQIFFFIYSSIFRNYVAANMCHVLQVDRQLNGKAVMGSFSSYWIKSVSFLLLWLYLYTNKAMFKASRSLLSSQQKCVFSLQKGEEFRLIVGSCNAYIAFVFEWPFGRNFFLWKEIKYVNPCKMCFQDLFLTSSDHRDASIGVMGVSGSPGRTVPFLE